MLQNGFPYVGMVIPSITQLEVFLINVIIRNQDIKKLETTCFGLTLAIIRFHLEKLFCKNVIQLCKRVLVLSYHHLRVWLDTAYSTGVKSYYYPDAVYLQILFNNQPDAIIQIFSVIKLYMFRASSVPNIRSFLLYFRHW